MHALNGFHLAQTTVLDGITDDDLKKISLVVFNRDSGIFDVDKQIARLKRLKIPYVMDMDDYWILDKKHLMHKAFKNDISHRIIKLLKGARGVTTTIARLARKIDQYNKNVLVVPNAIDSTQPQWQEVPTSNPSPRFGWVGGVHHVEDIRLLLPAFEKIHAEDKVHLALGGFSHNDVYMVFDAWFSARGTYQKYNRIFGRDVYNYGNIYNSLDVALIPLCDNKFNACKSPLKILEAGFKGKPCIVSRVAPYTDDFTDKEVLFVDSPSDWYDSIMKLHNNPELLLNYKEALKEKVKEYDISKVNILREQFYNRIING
jgi:glycosyltransferase involved in cell wall biosynthesis